MQAFDTYGIIKDGNEVKRIMNKLTLAQREFLNEITREASRNLWSKTLITLKGGPDKIDLTSNSINGWSLMYVEDLGSLEGVCACGHHIRYAYHVENVEDFRRMVFGAICIQKHLGIHPNSAIQIAMDNRNMTADRDEILYKVDRGWVATNVRDAVETGKITPTEEEKRFLELGLPLLCRHEESIRERGGMDVETARKAPAGIKRRKLF